jgi:L-fuconolactonase
MDMIGDSKGEYPGLAYRDEADLQAWLAKRPTEAALEPDLPIIDPHHHFWDTPQRGRYLLRELLDDIGGGHNIVSTVFLECRSMYRKDGPAEMAPVGEVEFVNGIAAMSASGG